MESLANGKYRARFWQLFYTIQIRLDIDDIRLDMGPYSAHIWPDMVLHIRMVLGPGFRKEIRLKKNSRDRVSFTTTGPRDRINFSSAILLYIKLYSSETHHRARCKNAVSTLRLLSSKGYPWIGLPIQGFDRPSRCTFFISRNMKGCLQLGLPIQGFDQPSGRTFMSKGTCQ